MIHHASGYAELRPATLSENPRVKLAPWCRVEGVLKIGAKAAPAGTKVSLGNFSWNANAGRAHFGYATTTDAEGRYVLDRVPAGVVKINTKVSATGAKVDQYTAAAPDTPTRFDIGGAGRPIVGKLVLPADIDLKRLNKWPGVDSLCYFRRDVPWPRPSQSIDARSPGQDREDATRAWRTTQEAVDAYRNEYRCEIDPQPDGTFRLDDVPPGRYVLSLGFQRLGKTSVGDEIASKDIEVNVPDAPAPTDEPLDLGEIQLGSEGL